MGGVDCESGLYSGGHRLATLGRPQRKTFATENLDHLQETSVTAAAVSDLLALALQPDLAASLFQPKIPKGVLKASFAGEPEKNNELRYVTRFPSDPVPSNS